MKNMNHIASAIAKLEGKKNQVSIGNIREVLKVLVHLCAEQKEDGSTDALDVLFNAILKQYEKNQSKAKKKAK